MFTNARISTSSVIVLFYIFYSKFWNLDLKDVLIFISIFNNFPGFFKIMLDKPP